MPATYLDLLNADGSRNAAGFAALLAQKIDAEINLRLCAAARLYAPSHLAPGEVPQWRREVAVGLDISIISPKERAAIVAHERAELEEWITYWQRGRARQRGAMDAAYLQAAE